MLTIGAPLGLAALVVPALAQTVERGYAVGTGDVIRVDAFQHTDISGEFLVEESGAITYPLIGTVHVADMTVAEISNTLEVLLEKDFYVDVQLQVEVTEYRSKPVTVLGEVQRPGTYYLRARTTLTQMLADAGGLRPSAGPTLELRRIEVVDGREVQTVFDFSTAKLVNGEEGQEVELRVGDVLSIPAKQLYFITGEVARPGQYDIERAMTLMQAISQAGGQGKFASQSIEVHRESGGVKEILHFDLSQIRKGREEDPPIRSGDVIIVRKRFF